MEGKKTDLLELLLRPEVPNVQEQLPTAQYKMRRLSQLLGEDVVFRLRGLPYGKVQSIRSSNSRDANLDILLAGCKVPDLKDIRLRERFGGATPEEMVKNLLLPGEIEDLARAIERLCGYRRVTIEEVKNG